MQYNIGDGTCHEILQGIYGNEIKIKTNLVLIPLGTANALYHSTHSSSTLDKDSVDYKLLSIKSYLSKQSSYLNLNTANVYIDDKPHQIGHVVVSTAVHAALLHRSEELRQTDNSINRFKTAFSEVCKHWTQGTVSLSGCRSYDVNKMKFNDDQEDITLDGPFTYLLATTQVDRLEEKFVIAPNAVSVKGLTIVIVRPLRNLKVKQLYENGKLYDAVNEAANDLTKVMFKAYENGEHLKVTNENSQFTVEFFNAQQLAFKSKSNDGHNEDYVCVDGSLTKLNKEFAVQLNDSNLLKLIL